MNIIVTGGKVQPGVVGHEMDAAGVGRNRSGQCALRGGGSINGRIALRNEFSFPVEAEHCDAADGLLFSADITADAGARGAGEAEFYGHFPFGDVQLPFRNVDFGATCSQQGRGGKQCKKY